MQSLSTIPNSRPWPLRRQLHLQRTSQVLRRSRACMSCLLKLTMMISLSKASFHQWIKSMRINHWLDKGIQYKAASKKRDHPLVQYKWNPALINKTSFLRTIWWASWKPLSLVRKARLNRSEPFLSKHLLNRDAASSIEKPMLCWSVANSL